MLPRSLFDNLLLTSPATAAHDRVDSIGIDIDRLTRPGSLQANEDVVSTHTCLSSEATSSPLAALLDTQLIEPQFSSIMCSIERGGVNEVIGIVLDTGCYN